MNHLALTILAAVILMGLVVLGLSIGLILTGKSRLKRGCGQNPDRNQKDKSTECPLCGDEKICKDGKDENGVSNSKK